MRLLVEYSMPVYCVVDTGTKEIMSVIEDVEQIEPTGRTLTDELDVLPREHEVTRALIEIAEEIAEGSDWPARDRGF